MSNESKNVSVIVSLCVKGTKPGEGRIVGFSRVEEIFSSLEEALVSGKSRCAEGKSVVVRPDYNEMDAQGRFFREWRSFNGEELKEVRFPVYPLF